MVFQCNMGLSMTSLKLKGQVLGLYRWSIECLKFKKKKRVQSFSLLGGWVIEDYLGGLADQRSTNDDDWKRWSLRFIT